MIRINVITEGQSELRFVQAVAYQKGDLPAEWREFITIDRIREKCPHFSEWIERMKRIIRS